MKPALCTLCLFTIGFALIGPAQAGFGDSDQQRQQRWHDVQNAVFGSKPVTRDDKAISLESPVRAEDAALVPITIDIAKPSEAKGLYLIIDDNPSPLAAHFTFGPDADPREVKLRVRVDAYTDLHAIVETKSGLLLETTKFIKASGGCSAPAGLTPEEAMKGMGEMRLKLAGDMGPGKMTMATLMIRHPNFNGMQMDPISRNYTPARYIKTVSASLDGKLIFTLDTDISLSTNPVITFGIASSKPAGSLKVAVADNQSGHWTQTFNLPNVSN